MTNKGRKLKLKWIILPAVIVAVTITMIHSKKNRDIPEKLFGKWTTSASGYEDRFLEITKETLTYGLGGDKEDVNFISSIEESLAGNRILYTITYKNTDGLEFTRSFNYVPKNGGAIRFKHQEHIEWRKMKDDASKENSETDQNKKAGQNETNS
ncbi:MAG: hypothetical protein WBY47_03225 [Desulfobacterales bacterium]|jgi:hypothetical protein